MTRKDCHIKFLATEEHEKTQRNVKISFHQNFPFYCASAPFFLAKILMFYFKF